MKHKFTKSRRITDKEKVSCGYKPELDHPEATKRPPAKFKFECKRGKGKHVFELVPNNLKKTKLKDWFEYKCKNCGKEECRFVKMPYKKIKTPRGYFYEQEKKPKCEICGVEIVPDLEAKDNQGMWDEHSFKYPCNCHAKNLRIAIGNRGNSMALP